MVVRVGDSGLMGLVEPGVLVGCEHESLVSGDNDLVIDRLSHRFALDLVEDESSPEDVVHVCIGLRYQMSDRIDRLFDFQLWQSVVDQLRVLVLSERLGGLVARQSRGVTPGKDRR